jgi:signal transduction histidine kinase
MWSRLTSPLYVRIWLAVVLTVAVLTFLVGWVWRMSNDPVMPVREIVVRNQAGQVIGTAQSDPSRRASHDMRFDVVTSDGQTLDIRLPRPPRPPASGGPMMRPPFGFFWMLALVGLAVALAAYPIIRRLTLRLEALQRGVERWGDGDLSARVPVHGRDEVAFLAERFNHAAERIETLMDSQKALLNAHKNLLANASHELRSPLARIRMGLELLAPTLPAARGSLPPEGALRLRPGKAGSAAPAEQGLVAPTLPTSLGSLPPEGALRLRPGEAGSAALAERGLAAYTFSASAASAAAQRREISRSISELDQLIDEILLASRLDSGQTDNEPMEVLDLTGLAAEECARVNAELQAGPDRQRGEASEAAAEAEDTPSLLLRGSPRLLRRLLRNLLENARRYSTGDVTLALSPGGSAAQPSVVIRVNDCGPGVPLAQRKRIFEPFYRLPGASEREGGVGLGLALVKSIAERHGGTVRCEDRPGGGASFVVELPASR